MADLRVLPTLFRAHKNNAAFFVAKSKKAMISLAPGEKAVGRLLVDKSGGLFGTAGSGGAAPGEGTIFKLSPPGKARTTWTETTLWTFTGGSDGVSPASGLVADKAGTLYGTSELGATSRCEFGFGCGAVFSLTGSGYEP